MNKILARVISFSVITIGMILFPVNTTNASVGYNNYIIQDLGTLGGTFSAGSEINNLGKIVGDSGTADNVARHIFLYENGAMTDIGTLGGTYAEGHGINNIGQAVGGSYLMGDNFYHGFLYENGAMTDIGTLGGTYAEGTDINDNGQIVGRSSIAGDTATRAFIYNNGNMTDLGTLGGNDSFAFGINGLNQVVGYSWLLGNSSYHAFLYDDGIKTDLGTLGGDRSVALKVNDSSQVVGFSEINSGSANGRAFLYNNGSMINLGTLGGFISQANSINNFGQVVGYSYLAGNTTSHAFIYTNGQMLDLNNFLPIGSGWNYLVNANDINEYGQITGVGVINGENHAFLLTPQQPQLKVIKQVINTSGGDRVASDFTMNVTGTNVSNPSFPGSGSGTTIYLDFGPYRVSETGPVGYFSSYSSDCIGTILPGEIRTCTIINDDDAHVSSLSPANLWVGLKNNASAGINFDLLAEVYKDGQLIGDGQLDNVPAGGVGFNRANLNSIPLSLPMVTYLPYGSTLSIKLYIRNACAGPVFNTGVARLWYNDTDTNSQFGATIALSDKTYFLRDNFNLTTTTGTGPKKTIDVTVGPNCGSFNTFGTWSIITSP